MVAFPLVSLQKWGPTPTKQDKPLCRTAPEKKWNLLKWTGKWTVWGACSLSTGNPTDQRVAWLELGPVTECTRPLTN